MREHVGSLRAYVLPPVPAESVHRMPAPGRD
jgi:hypothetical protein